MSFDEYVQHVKLKYRLAIAVSILKNKPENVTVEQYINQLQRDINRHNEMAVDIETIICDEDFNFDNDIMVDDVNDGESGDGSISNDSVNILQGYDINGLDLGRNETHNVESNVSDALKVLKDIDGNILEENTTELLQTQSTYCESVRTQNNRETTENDNDVTFCDSFISKNEGSITNIAEIIKLRDKSEKRQEDTNIDNNADDSQQTEIYSLRYYTQNNSCISQSQGDNVVIPQKYISGKNQQCKPKKSVILIRKDMVFKITDGKVVEPKKSENIENSIPCEGSIDNAQNFDTNYLENTNEDENKDPIKIKTQIINKSKENNEKATENCSYSDNFGKSDLNQSKTSEICEKSKENPVIEDFTIKDIYSSSQINSSTNENNSKANDNRDNFGVTENPVIEKEDGGNSEQNTEDFLLEELTNSQAELIPFKIIEELNKIKRFLEKKERRMSTDGYSSDSGYRSDSKTGSWNALQLSMNTLNQSAHHLFTYITHCPMVVSTERIVKEISQVLGHFIDRLHEDENYPSFLEDILENIDILLRDIHEEAGSEDNALLKREESIYRLFLLNSSQHIVKYTIEKIIKILKNVYEILKDKTELYELENIEKMENLSYIFHILEYLLQKYIKNNKHLSQTSTQTSQDEDKLKRSSITDIWRKTWNPKYKMEKVEGSCEKVCILTQCNAILNQIIVECMDGYSLVAFAALQCFNLLQS